MAEEVKEEKKESKKKVKDVSYVSLIACVLIMVLGVFALGVYAGFRYSKGANNKCAVEDKLEEKKEEEKEEKVEIKDVESFNEGLKELNLGLQFALEPHKKGNYYGFEDINSGEELLKTDSDKLNFAWFVALKNKQYLMDTEASQKLGVPEATGTRAILVSDFKEVYKDLYGEDLKYDKDIPFTSFKSQIVKNYIVGSFWTGWFLFKTELTFDNLTKKGDEYTLTINISYLDESSYSYIPSNDKIILKYVESSNNNNTLKSMTLKK